MRGRGVESSLLFAPSLRWPWPLPSLHLPLLPQLSPPTGLPSTSPRVGHLSSAIAVAAIHPLMPGAIRSSRTPSPPLQSPLRLPLLPPRPFGPTSLLTSLLCPTPRLSPPSLPRPLCPPLPLLATAVR